MTLLGEFGFEETTGNVLDTSGNGFDFALGANGARSASGHAGQGFVKTGATMPILAAGLNTASQTLNRTVMMWCIAPSTTWLIRWQVDSINSGSWGILNVSGTIGIQARNASTLARPTFATPGDGLWHHYTGTYDQTNVRLYFDGVLKTTTALAGPLRTDADRIDMAEWTTGTPVIDDIRMFDTCLDATAIQAEMATPSRSNGAFLALM